jgi:hypothetical protein
MGDFQVHTAAIRERVRLVLRLGSFYLMSVSGLASFGILHPSFLIHELLVTRMDAKKVAVNRRTLALLA